MDYLQAVLNNLQDSEERRDRTYHAICPFCGKAPHVTDKPNVKATHFHFNNNFYKCFVCGAGGSLYKLCKHINADTSQVTEAWKPKPRPTDKELINASPFPWMFYDSKISNSGFHQWTQYKPVKRSTINKFGLYYGPLFNQRTPRLVVPIAFQGKVWGQKGRLPNNSPMSGKLHKWMFAKNSLVKIWGMDLVEEGEELWIVENLVDAILLYEEGINAISTGGLYGITTNKAMSYIHSKNVSRVVIAFDNDASGGGNKETVDATNAKRETEGLIPLVPQAPIIRKTLDKHGIPAVCREWPNGTAPKTDIGDVISKMRG